MKLQDLAQQNTAKNKAKIVESYFGEQRVDIAPALLRPFLKKLQAQLAECKRSAGFYSSERNPQYLKLLMVEQALRARLDEYTGTSTVTSNAVAPGQGATSSGSTSALKPAKYQIDPKKALTTQAVPTTSDLDTMLRDLPANKQQAMRATVQSAKTASGPDARVAKQLAATSMSALVDSADSGGYKIKFSDEDDVWTVIDSVGNHVESFIDKAEAAREARKLNAGKPAAKSFKHVNSRGDVDMSEGCSTKGKQKPMKETKARKLREGAVKTMMMDLKELSAAEFKTKYNMTKAEARKELKPEDKKKVDENKLSSTPLAQLLEFYKRHRGTKHSAVEMVESEIRRRRAVMESQRRGKRSLTEGEVQQAQVVLAAQDMVDQVQKWIESASSAQFKDLSALVSQIRLDQGPDQSAQFNQAATGAFQSLIQALQSAKEQLEGAVGIVTGQGGGVTPPPVNTGDIEPDGKMPPAKDSAEMPDLDLDDETADITGLGRERR